MTKQVLAVAIGLGVAGVSAVGCGGPGRPNVVLVVVDSLRADALGCYGTDPSPSPAIDRLAAEGVRFEHAVAPASWNLPSVSSLVTSTPPWVHGQGAPASGTSEVTTLAEAFGAAGYRTGAFTEVAWPLLQQGFETFQNTAFGHTFGNPETNSAARTLRAALDWARQDDARPFFLLVHTYEVHSYFLGKPHQLDRALAEHPGYEGPFRDWAVRDLSRPAAPQVMDALLQADPDDLDFVRSLYRAAVTGVDAEVDRFVRGLGDAGLDESTVLTLTSSNGEGFRPDLGRVHHGGRLHDDVLRVPLILRWPGGLDPGVVDSLASLLDVAPTLASLAGVALPAAFSGYPLIVPEDGWLSVATGPRFAVQARPPEPIVAQEAAFRVLPSGERAPADEPQYALYTNWVTFIDTGDDVELYDLKVDPTQEHDRSAEHLKGIEGLRKQVRRIAESGASAAGGPDAEQLEQLRSLGYVQ